MVELAIKGREKIRLDTLCFKADRPWGLIATLLTFVVRPIANNTMVGLLMILLFIYTCLGVGYLAINMEFALVEPGIQGEAAALTCMLRRWGFLAGLS